jgi:hypothetical protein
VFKVIKEAQGLKAHLVLQATREFLGSVVQLESKAKKETQDL